MRGVRTVQVVQTFPASVAEAERCWYDTSHWDGWVDGLDTVLEVAPGWPEAGSSVRWASGPAGRGHVTERVVAYHPADGQTMDVSDDSIAGRQSVAFAAVPHGVEVTLRLEYGLNKTSPLTPLIDLVFIKRAMVLSLSRMLARFGARLARAGGTDVEQISA
jgi:Polyketide cyclase / dehydrase and lipid transport